MIRTTLARLSVSTIKVDKSGPTLNPTVSPNHVVLGGTATVWKTENSWAGSCRMLTVKLTDGTEHTAYFTFSK